MGDPQQREGAHFLLFVGLSPQYSAPRMAHVFPVVAEAALVDNIPANQHIDLDSRL